MKSESRLRHVKNFVRRVPEMAQGCEISPNFNAADGRAFMKAIDLSGEKFNRLTVINKSHRIGTRVYWLCRCDCGKEHTVQASKLKSGHTKSCGCYRTEVRKSVKSHGEAAGGKLSSEYSIWRQMISRCGSVKCKTYSYYGGRGISVCERWKDVSKFIEDMGRRPSKLHSVERRDNDKGYSPDNCYWATKMQQANNRRSNVIIEFGGETMNLKQWSEKTGISYATLHQRLRAGGWTIEKILTTPTIRVG